MRAAAGEALESLIAALKVATRWIENDSAPLGWSVDRLREVITAADALTRSPQPVKEGWLAIEDVIDGVRSSTGHKMSCRKFTPPTVKMFPGDLVFDDSKPCTCSPELRTEQR